MAAYGRFLYDALTAQLYPLGRHPNLRAFSFRLVDNSDLNALASVMRGPPDHEIVEHETRLRDAQLSGDAAALDSLLGDDLLFTGPDGRLATKAEDLEAHRSGAVRFQSHQPEELRIRRLNDSIALVALRAQLAVAIGDSIVRGTFRYTRIWQRDVYGAWRVVGGHVSEVADSRSSSGAP